jgi:uncharacterized protein (DUF1919 family)
MSVRTRRKFLTPRAKAISEARAGNPTRLNRKLKNSCYFPATRMAAVSLPIPGAAPRPNVWEPLKLWRRRVAAHLMRRRVTNRNFTIVSNDCFGGMAYEELGMRYESPFVGLFIVPEDYLELLRHLRPHMARRIEFASQSRRDAINHWREQIRKPYPIGRLGDVEIHFLHYPGHDAAEAKWTRRAQRIHWDNLLVKICWHDGPEMPRLLREFDALPFGRKLSLVPQALPGVRSCVALDRYSTDGTWQYWASHLHFDVAAWLNTGTIRRLTWTRVVDWLLYWHY